MRFSEGRLTDGEKQAIRTYGVAVCRKIPPHERDELYYDMELEASKAVDREAIQWGEEWDVRDFISRKVHDINVRKRWTRRYCIPEQV